MSARPGWLPHSCPQRAPPPPPGPSVCVVLPVLVPCPSRPLTLRLREVGRLFTAASSRWVNVCGMSGCIQKTHSSLFRSLPLTPLFFVFLFFVCLFYKRLIFPTSVLPVVVPLRDEGLGGRERAPAFILGTPWPVAPSGTFQLWRYIKVDARGIKSNYWNMRNEKTTTKWLLTSRPAQDEINFSN